MRRSEDEALWWLRSETARARRNGTGTRGSAEETKQLQNGLFCRLLLWKVSGHDKKHPKILNKKAAKVTPSTTQK